MHGRWYLHARKHPFARATRPQRRMSENCFRVSDPTSSARPNPDLLSTPRIHRLLQSQPHYLSPLTITYNTHHVVPSWTPSEPAPSGQALRDLLARVSPSISSPLAGPYDGTTSSSVPTVAVLVSPGARYDVYDLQLVIAPCEMRFVPFRRDGPDARGGGR